jgi:hypothetical protein
VAGHRHSGGQTDCRLRQQASSQTEMQADKQTDRQRGRQAEDMREGRTHVDTQTDIRQKACRRAALHAGRPHADM